MVISNSEPKIPINNSTQCAAEIELWDWLQSASSWEHVMLYQIFQGEMNLCYCRIYNWKMNRYFGKNIDDKKDMHADFILV